MSSTIRLLAVSGSLRRSSHNQTAIDAASRLAPDGIDVEIYRNLGDLPLFNPDLEGSRIAAVEDLKTALARADGLIIASPEYAHGISGVMKNALDWLVSGEEFVYLPVALINTSPRATHAQAALREVVTTMSGIIVEPACISLPLLGTELDAEGVVSDPDLAVSLKTSLSRFAEAIRE